MLDKRITRQDAPEPEEDESHDDFIDRCVDELTGEYDFLDDDMATDICEVAWDDRAADASGIRHKTTTKQDGGGDGLDFILSDETVDRYGDVISSDGWKLANFKRNPIALFGHRSDAPIGTWRNLRVEDKALKGTLVLADEGTSPRIDELRKLVDARILRAVSVGFHSIKMEDRKDDQGNWLGWLFKEQELVETSLVSVPANPNALAVAKSLDISPATLDLVFAKHGNRDAIRRRRGFTGKHAAISRKGKGNAMTLAQRIQELEAQITERRVALQAHLDGQNDSNVSDAELETTRGFNADITQLEKQHGALVESERALGQSTDGQSRALAPFVAPANGQQQQRTTHSTYSGGKQPELSAVDYMVRAAVVAYRAKTSNRGFDDCRKAIYGDHEPTREACNLLLRAASAPAMTAVTGWAAELVQQIYTTFMDLLMPKSILPSLAGKGLELNFGAAGRIIIPTRSRTPTVAGSFVGEGQAIPVRQGAFTTQTLTPKKMAVITTWTREMGDHSIPAIEGLLREAVQQDTSVAVDTVLIDANPATVIRPAGLLNGVAATTATAGGGLAALIGDIKALIASLTQSTFGNIREPAWLMNPSDVLAASLTQATNTGIFPFRDEILERGTLNTIPIIASATVPLKTMILDDAADFVVVGGEAPRLELSDVATLHMEDTAPLDLVGGSPAVVAAPQRSLFQTDSLALRMVMPLNWIQRRAGTVAWTQNTTWS